MLKYKIQIFIFFCVKLLAILSSSASLRSSSSNPIMLGETFARIRTLSSHLPDPSWSDRAMHELLCMNIKLTRKVLTRNVLRRIMELNIGTNEVEKYASMLSKQNVRKVRNAIMFIVIRDDLV